MGGTFVLAAWVLTAPLADPTPEQLVRDLGSPVFSVRDKASKALWKLGEKARPALTEGLKSNDPEISQRCKAILDKFESGVFPDTPPDVLKQIEEFRTGLLTNQQKAVTMLIRQGEPAVPTLRVLLRKDLSKDNRGPLFDHLTWTLRREVPRLLLAGQTDFAEALLSLNAFGPNDGGLLDYAVFLHLRGKAAAVAKELELVKAKGGAEAQAATKALAFVYRAAGNGPKAKAMALDYEGYDPEFRESVDSLLEDLGAWAELTERPFGRVNSEDGLKLFRLRLAGKTKEAKEILDRQKDEALGETSGAAVDAATLALMLNDRPLDGLDRLRVQRNAPHILADCLASRLELKEALDLLGGNKKIDEASGLDTELLRQLYGTRRGRLLWQLGQRDAAAQVFAQLAEKITSPDDYALVQLVRAEVRAGRYDLACEHLGRVLASNPDSFRGGTSYRQDPFEVVFEADAENAQFLWNSLQRAKLNAKPPGAQMRLVRSLLTGTAAETEIELARKAANAGLIDADTMPTLALALAAVYRAHNKPNEAIAELSRMAAKLAKPVEEPNESEDVILARRYGRGSRAWVFGTDESFKFWVELGDLLAEQGKHQEAAEQLERGWKLYPDNGILLFLAGRERIKAGDEKEGKRRCELAHWVGLGNPRVRGRFLEELITRGFLTDVRQERDLVREAGWVSELHLGNVWNQVARGSTVLKDFPSAAAANNRAIHYLLRTPGVSYVEGYAYLTVPQTVRANMARGLLADGKIEEALKIAKECLAVMPGNADLAIAMVPELDKRNRKADADAMFQSVWNAYSKMAKDNPDSGWARYMAAWLAAGCQRELDAGLAFAKAAVEFEPNMKSYQEALAELHFRKGNRAEAVAILKKLVAGDRRNFHYQRQLERYQTSDPKSPLPDGDDD